MDSLLMAVHCGGLLLPSMRPSWGTTGGLCVRASLCWPRGGPRVMLTSSGVLRCFLDLRNAVLHFGVWVEPLGSELPLVLLRSNPLLLLLLLLLIYLLPSPPLSHTSAPPPCHPRAPPTPPPATRCHPTPFCAASHPTSISAGRLGRDPVSRWEWGRRPPQPLFPLLLPYGRQALGWGAGFIGYHVLSPRGLPRHPGCLLATHSAVLFR